MNHENRSLGPVGQELAAAFKLPLIAAAVSVVTAVRFLRSMQRSVRNWMQAFLMASPSAAITSIQEHGALDLHVEDQLLLLKMNQYSIVNAKLYTVTRYFTSWKTIDTSIYFDK